MKKCKAIRCERPYYAKGLCNFHWQRERSGINSDADLKRRPNGVARLRDSEGRKQCMACQLWLAEDLFSNHPATTDGKAVRCRPCVYVARHSTQYKLMPEDIARIMEEQGRACAICRADISGRYVVDHDHSCCPGTRSCGKCVRGFLCDGCNHGLGSFRDSIESLHQAIVYLKN